jgi:hypothetical protein
LICYLYVFTVTGRAFSSTISIAQPRLLIRGTINQCLHILYSFSERPKYAKVREDLELTRYARVEVEKGIARAYPVARRHSHLALTGFKPRRLGSTSQRLGGKGAETPSLATQRSEY